MFNRYVSMYTCVCIPDMYYEEIWGWRGCKPMKSHLGGRDITAFTPIASPSLWASPSLRSSALAHLCLYMSLHMCDD